MKQTVVKLGYATAIGVAGLAMLFWGIDKNNLLDTAARRAGEQPKTSAGVLVVLMLGVFLLNIAVFSSLTVWSRHRRAHPPVKQAPLWSLVVVIVAAGAFGLVSYAAHNSRIQGLAVLPTSVDLLFIAQQVVAGAIVVGTLVLVGVRWTPRHRPARATR